MKKNVEKLQIIFLTFVLVLFYAKTSEAETKTNGFIMPYFNIASEYKGLLLDSNIRFRNSLNEQFGLGFSISPIQLRSERNHWNPFPEYYIYLKDDNLGKISVGQCNSNGLLVDGRSFAVGEFLGDTDYSSFYTPLLTDGFGRRKYNFKLAYLSPQINERFYFSSSYTTKTDISEVRFFYGDTINASTDFKSSLGFINRKVSAGFNLQYLGLIVGGSIGEKLHTAGIGYSIGPIKTSLTYLHYKNKNNILLGSEYKLRKDLSSFIYINSLTDNRKSVSILMGIKFLT